MTDTELRNYLKQFFPQENSRCEWKEFKNLTLVSLNYC